MGCHGARHEMFAVQAHIMALVGRPAVVEQPLLVAGTVDDREHAAANPAYPGHYVPNEGHPDGTQVAGLLLGCLEQPVPLLLTGMCTAHSNMRMYKANGRDACGVIYGAHDWWHTCAWVVRGGSPRRR